MTERLDGRPGNRVGRERRRRRRKAALALSAGFMSLGTAAMPAQAPLPSPAQPISSPRSPQRKPAAMLQPSKELLEAMIEEEGARRTVYRDIAGNPTVGVGHLVTSADNLEVGDRISQDEVLDFLERDLATAQQAVVRLVGDLPLHQNEFDALVDLAFNVGEGNLSADRSPGLNAAIARRDYDAIAAELDYRHAAGHVAGGLVYRSERRENIFSQASYADPRGQPALKA